MVVQSQLFFTESPSRTCPKGKYEVMRWPSAYCATSSGIAMLRGRVSTHPTFPSRVRTKFQSSIGTSTGGAGAATGGGASSGPSGDSGFGVESASQFSGGFGAGGRGGGLILVAVELGLGFLRVGAGFTGMVIETSSCC